MENLTDLIEALAQLERARNAAAAIARQLQRHRIAELVEASSAIDEHLLEAL